MLDFVVAESKHLVNDATSQVWRFAEQRITHDVEIGIPCQAEARAEGRSSSFFDVDDNLRGVVDAGAGIQRQYAREGFFIMRAETVFAAVGSMETGMGLE